MIDDLTDIDGVDGPWNRRMEEPITRTWRVEYVAQGKAVVHVTAFNQAQAMAAADQEIQERLNGGVSWMAYSITEVE